MIFQIVSIIFLIKDLEKKQDMMTMMEIWQIIRVILYLVYDTSKEFLTQFE